MAIRIRSKQNPQTMHNHIPSKPSISARSLKRLLDIACCLLALPLLAIMAVVIATLMRVVSPGPLFFLQERVGQNGRRFKLYKFRTMHVCADPMVHQQYFSQLVGSNAPMMKLDQQGDSRLILGCWLLRASGLDELPQIINVLRGEMSVVGPRPCMPQEYELYTPAQRKRFTAAPGLTGLWQVSGKNRTTFEEMVRLDIKYAETASLALDLWIILKTIPALLQQIGDTSRRRHHLRGVTASPFPISGMLTDRNKLTAR